MTQRRGFTLVEVLLALVIMGLVTGAIYRLLVNNQRLAEAQAEQVSLQSNVRTGSLVVPNELRELNTVLGGNATQNDVTFASATAIEYRAMRGLGFLCQASTANEMRIDATTGAKTTWAGARNPDAARDDLYLFVDGDTDEDDDDTWVQVQVTAVANSTCGAKTAIRMTVAPVPPAAALPIVAAGTPVRLYEVMRLELWQDPTGRYWLGARSVSGGEANLQPVLGPLTNNGFELQYFNSAGNLIANPNANLNAITSIRVTMQGLTDHAVRAGGTAALGHPVEALATQVLLRNSIRP
jgi:prepilin-type N-terminal cleavage/methylation domain-containing protein